MNLPQSVPFDLPLGAPLTITCICGRKFLARVGDKFVAEQDAYGTCARHYIEGEPTTTGTPL
jgi:hypothetical protein